MQALRRKVRTVHLLSIVHFNYNPLKQAVGISVAPEDTFISGGRLGQNASRNFILGTLSSFCKIHELGESQAYCNVISIRVQRLGQAPSQRSDLLICSQFPLGNLSFFPFRFCLCTYQIVSTKVRFIFKEAKANSSSVFYPLQLSASC